MPDQQTVQAPQARLTVKRANGGIEIVLSMSNADYDDFEQVARIRGVTLAEAIAEALRLERLFAEARASSEQTLWYQQQRGGELRELIAV